ncbi:MAG: cupin domain-containing protein [Bacillota bacterium]
MGIWLYDAKQIKTNQVNDSWGSLQWLAGKGIGDSEDTAAGRVIIKKGACNPRHAHPNCDEILYLLQGRLEHTVGDEKVTVAPGDVPLTQAK